MYIVPDASKAAKIALFQKQVDLEMNHPNYMSAGDYNMDCAKLEIRRFIKAHAGGTLNQVVKSSTRKKWRMVGGSQCTSQTQIDLV